MLGYRRAGPDWVGGACGPPSPSLCASAALLLGMTPLLLGELGALQRSRCLLPRKGWGRAWGGAGPHCLALGTEGAGGPAAAQWVECTWSWRALGHS